MDKTAAKREWILQNVTGPRVLLVGAVPRFEGAELALARRGMEVCVLCSDGECVSQATRALFDEDPAVRRQVEYLQGDVASQSFAPASFDTIVIDAAGDDLAALCEAALPHLTLGGHLLVLTIPGSPEAGQHLVAHSADGRLRVLGHEWVAMVSQGSLGEMVCRIGNGELEYGQVSQTPAWLPLSMQRLGGDEWELKNSILTLRERVVAQTAAIAELRAVADDRQRELLRTEEERRDARQQAEVLQGHLEAMDRTMAELLGREAILESRLQTLQADRDALSRQAQELTRERNAWKKRSKTAGVQAMKSKKATRMWKKKYRAVLRSRRYRMGAALADIARHPLRAVPYTGRLLRALYRRALRKPLHPFPFDGVSVIIPTYKRQPYLEACVNSVLRQTLPRSKVEILLSVNGKDQEYYQWLRDKYAAIRRVKVLYTPVPGLSSGRNFALTHATRQYVTFLDDDDYFTPGYLAELTAHLDGGIDVVCGRLVDERPDGQDADTYINRELGKIPGGGKTKNLLHVGSLFSPACAKLFRTELFRTAFTPFDETVTHTEDIRFWADNFHKLTKSIYCCNGQGHQAYVRRILPNSMSRPTQESLYSFWITDRVKLITHMAKGIFQTDRDVPHKRFLLNKINQQTKMMAQHFNDMPPEGRERAAREIRAAGCFYLNRNKFPQVRGIAFCHNFPPFADASSFVAAKRLTQISDHMDKNVEWNVVTANMENMRPKDRLFAMFYSSFVIHSRHEIPGPAYFNEKAQHRFGVQAFEAMQEVEAQVIYSRSMFAGSHVGAALYKEHHPEVVWYAEFSDPLGMNTDNEKRTAAKVYEGEEAFLNTFWQDLETTVYRLADVIVFTNENQREYMLAHAEDKTWNERARRHSLILHHPILDRQFSQIVDAHYNLDPNKINIGYFGSFYANRKHSDMLRLLDNPAVVLHLFVPNPDALQELAGDRVRVNLVVDHLSFLNIASRMDYLYLNDIDFTGQPNPYLPSKYADYLASGARIIAQVNEGTILSREEQESLIKIAAMDDSFVAGLHKGTDPC